jgi:ATP-dependent RNA helicase DHX8/PRP22
MLPSPVLDIQLKKISLTILMLKAVGLNDLLNFDFMDPPHAQTLLTALDDKGGLLTRLGRKMADFPMEPPLSKMLIASVDLGCSGEILTVAAMLSVQNVFYQPKEN